MAADTNAKDAEAVDDSPTATMDQLTPQELERKRELLNILADTEIQSLLPSTIEALVRVDTNGTVNLGGDDDS